MTSVLITRPKELSEELSGSLMDDGFDTYIAPMLEYKTLEFDLSDIEKFKTLIFTSMEAIKVFSKKTDNRNFSVITVGNSTAKKAQELGFKTVFSVDGDVGDLVKFIESKDIKNSLYLCGQDVQNELKVNKRAVYKADFIKNMPLNVIKAIEKSEIDKILLFSSRSAKNLVQLFKNNRLSELSSAVDVICISNNVANKAKNLPWKSILIAENPNLEDVLKTLKN